jgi:hypothetical protein
MLLITVLLPAAAQGNLVYIEDNITAWEYKRIRTRNIRNNKSNCCE